MGKNSSNKSSKSAGKSSPGPAVALLPTPDYVADVTSKSLTALGDATIAFATNFRDKFIPQDDSLPPEKKLEILQTVVVAYLANASNLASGVSDGVRSGSQQGQDR